MHPNHYLNNHNDFLVLDQVDHDASHFHIVQIAYRVEFQYALLLLHQIPLNDNIPILLDYKPDDYYKLLFEIIINLSNQLILF